MRLALPLYAHMDNQCSLSSARYDTGRARVVRVSWEASDQPAKKPLRKGGIGVK